MINRRVFVERKPGFEIESHDYITKFKQNFQIELKSLRYLIVYDLFNIEEEVYNKTLTEVFSEPNKDIVTDSPNLLNHVIAYEYLPGQFDQRADSALQCVKLINPKSKASIKSGAIITFSEEVSDTIIGNLKNYLINRVEAREKDLSILLLEKNNPPTEVKTINNFISSTRAEIDRLHEELSLAMSIEDLLYIQDYFKNEEFRDPTETEIRVLDTYWSDHCRHTTFETEIKRVDFIDDDLTNKIQKVFEDYLNTRKLVNRDNLPITLMDIATINAKLERLKGNLDDLEVSEEVNAASIYINVDIDGKNQLWLLMFKNETHNHPTEIEPFGGASTCIGGAIRDPLSGRSYVYQAMRITGAGDVTADILNTLPGKLPQRVITQGAAHGYSSYGNQVGLATSFVQEIYHEGYTAKRMEIGAVIGATPVENVKRESPVSGDIVILLGGKTGRDGIGGATGSSKTHNISSIETSSAEVQKGNAPEERKIQRLFRNKEVAKLIKKSNDFGAGGVSVAIGELADGLIINLNNIPTKYEGINGTELAISESQERMAVVISKDDEEIFLSYCENENIEAVSLALVTNEKRLVMMWNGKSICNLSRAFINSSGVRQNVSIKVVNPKLETPFKRKYKGDNLQEEIFFMLEDLNITSQQGLVEMFDSTIGRTSVLAPYGGKYQLTKTQNSIHRIPVLRGYTKTVSMISYGFNPFISEWSPYHGAQYAIIESIAKNVAAGGNYKKIRFSFQEYFERLNKDELKWAKPLTALLGAYQALKSFSLAAIGGKDSMSGTYQDLFVPPTLVSFAVNTEKIDNVISNEFKSVGSFLYLIKHQPHHLQLPDYEQLMSNFEFINKSIQSGLIISAYALEFGGLAEAIIKASFGNKIGVRVETDLPLFDFNYGSILIESKTEIHFPNAVYLGETIDEAMIYLNETSKSIDRYINHNQKRFTEVFPILHQDHRIINASQIMMSKKEFKHDPVEKVKVLIPVFPGTNCEYDSAQAFQQVGAETSFFVFNNLSDKHIEQSIELFSSKIDKCHILMLSGGFSSGDEPDGSGKFIAAILRHRLVKNAIENHLKKKNLILGICNGFQALVKSGLLPYGRIKPVEEKDPILFKNSINRHISKFVNTKVSSMNSPWLSSFMIDEIHTIPISHGEGQFIVNEAIYHDLLLHNQIAFQYVDSLNRPTYNPQYNPNGSAYAIEGIISRDGLILGKMGHSERYCDGLFKNIFGNKSQDIFLNAVRYFKGENK
jgi:phosphoribosylformylglycinamidine synthase